MVRIVTDSTADLPSDLAAEFGIIVVPLNVHFGEESFRDRIDLTDEEFLRRLSRGRDLPKTSQPSVGSFEEVYRGLLPDRICSIHIAGEFSGTIGSARLGADVLGLKDLAIVDSRTVTMGLGWLAIAAARLARAEGSLDDCVAAVRERIPRTRVFAMLDTLEFLRRGGRIGAAAAFLGALLSVKPIIEVREGAIHPVARVRTAKNAIEHLCQTMRELAPWEYLCVLHTGNSETARPILEAAQEIFRNGALSEVVLARIGTVIMTHAGPGALGFAGIQAR